VAFGSGCATPNRGCAPTIRRLVIPWRRPSLCCTSRYPAAWN